MIVLASKSTVRQQILRNAGIDFVVVPADVDELAIKKEFLQQHKRGGGDTPIFNQENVSFIGALTQGVNFCFKKLAKRLASKKAAYVSSKDEFKNDSTLVISADQLCVCDGQLFDKPGTVENAIEQLLQLSGKTHQLMSAVSLYKNGQAFCSTVEIATLTMKLLSRQEATNYVQLDMPLDSCGAYKYEKNGNRLFELVDGDLDVIQGLPFKWLTSILENLNQT